MWADPVLRRALLIAALGLAAVQAAAAGFPPAYKPSVIEPKGAPDAYEFDLTAALARAKAE